MCPSELGRSGPRHPLLHAAPATPAPTRATIRPVPRARLLDLLGLPLVATPDEIKASYRDQRTDITPT